jgi:hypothetical protein
MPLPAPNYITDLNIYQLPGTPLFSGLLGLNQIAIDPVFGSRIMRLTDGSSGNGNFRSMQTIDDPSGYPIWNTDDTLIASKSTGGAGFLFQFDPVNMQGTQLGTDVPYKLVGPYCFSRVNPGIIYNVVNGSVLNALVYAFIGGVWVYQTTNLICDFADILPPGFNVNWNSDLTLSFDDTVFGMAFSEGNQNTGFYACLFKVGSGFRRLNTQTLEVIGDWGATGTAVLTNTSFNSFLLHGINQTPNPSYLTLSPVRTGGGTIVWNSAGLTLTQTKLSGHHCLGYLGLFTGNPGGGQYDAATYANPPVHTIVVPKQKGPPGLPAYQDPPQSYTGDQHSAFGPVDLNDNSLMYVTNGARSVFPFTSCWMGEVRAYDVTGAISGSKGTVYRICHTYNSGHSTEYITANSQFVPSHSGKFVAFNSDMSAPSNVGGPSLLGSTDGDAVGIIGTNGRGDIFIVAIYPGQLAPTITSANNVTFTQDIFNSFSINTTANPLASISEIGSLPSGIVLIDNGNGTATLSGIPTVNGILSLSIMAANGVLSDAVQPFTLTVIADQTISPDITSANNVTFALGVLGLFDVTTTGTPTPNIVESGSLPSGVTFIDNSNGTGTLGGTPVDVGIFDIKFTAINGVLPDSVQPFTLTVNPVTPPTDFTLEPVMRALGEQANSNKVMGNTNSNVNAKGKQRVSSIASN